MKQLEHLHELEGKTIIKTLKLHLSLIVTFEDSYAYLGYQQDWDGDVFLEMHTHSPSDYELGKAGIISEEEYTKRVKEQEQRSKQLERERELKQYERLKEKYE